MEKEKIILETIKNNPNLSYSEISKIIGYSKSTIQYYCNKNKIHRDRKLLQRLNNTDRNTELEFTNTALEIFNGSLLGDSSVTKYNRNTTPKRILNSKITSGHCIEQKEYLLYLKNLLELEGIKMNYTENNNINRSIIEGREVITYGRCDLSTRRSISFNKFRDKWYSEDNIKNVPRDIYEHFSELSLAIWFMDDGSKNNCSYYLHTESFTIEDINFLQKLLYDKFNIKTSIHINRKKPLIYIKAESRELFTEIVRPYICESMKYKLIT